MLNGHHPVNINVNRGGTASRRPHRKCRKHHLKFRIFEFPYYGESAAADKENLSDVLRRTEPRCTRKISVLKRGSDGEVGNSVTVDIADDCDGVAKECGGMFRLRVEQCTRPKCCDQKW